MKYRKLRNYSLSLWLFRYHLLTRALCGSRDTPFRVQTLSDHVTEKWISDKLFHFMQMFLFLTYHVSLKACPLKELAEEEELESCSLIHDSSSSCTYDNGSRLNALGKMCIWGRKMPGQFTEISCAATSNWWLSEPIYRCITGPLSFQKSMK